MLTQKQKEIRNKLDKIAEERSDNLRITPCMMDHVISNMHKVHIELVHVIKTEDKIDEISDIPTEVVQYNHGVSREWLDTVVEPFFNNIINFLDKHPEYCIKMLDSESRTSTCKGMLLNDIKSMLSDILD